LQTTETNLRVATVGHDRDIFYDGRQLLNSSTVCEWQRTQWLVSLTRCNFLDSLTLMHWQLRSPFHIIYFNVYFVSILATAFAVNLLIFFIFW